MTLSRTLLLLVLVSIPAYAADPMHQPGSSDASWSSSLESLHLVPWFTGMTHVNQDLKSHAKPVTRNDVVSTPGELKGVSCLKLRTYKVRRQETLPDDESAFVSYSTCQWTTNYQVRSAVQTVQEPQ
jgi:hypothetical protein